MKDKINIKAGEGRFQIEVQALRCGEDWCVAVYGGEKPHVGAVSLGQYEPERGSATVSTVTVYTHRDDVIAAQFAKAVAAARRCTAAVSAGIHVDAAGEAELAMLRAVSDRCLHTLLRAMEEDE